MSTYAPTLQCTSGVYVSICPHITVYKWCLCFPMPSPYSVQVVSMSLYAPPYSVQVVSMRPYVPTLHGTSGVYVSLCPQLTVHKWCICLLMPPTYMVQVVSMSPYAPNLQCPNGVYAYAPALQCTSGVYVSLCPYPTV